MGGLTKGPGWWTEDIARIEGGKGPSEGPLMGPVGGSYRGGGLMATA